MKQHYDFVFLTNTPSFYKINLCNQIALTHTVLLVLYGYGAEAVNTQIGKEETQGFDHLFLYEGDAAKRNRWVTFGKLVKLMKQLSYQKVLYSGWFVPEYNLCAFLTPKHKNCVICESSAMESHFGGIKGWMKRLIINRMSVALPSGTPHKELFTSLGFQGKIVVTGGVGIFNKQPRIFSQPSPKGEKKYIYVGRLIECKNLRFLIEQFNQLGKPLTIVGSGELSDELKAIAKSNITFLGFVDNAQLSAIYSAHDVFVLPSKYEPWGLVVEEALYHGLPVIASNRVGSYRDMVKKWHTGCMFSIDQPDSFQQAVSEIEQHYNRYRENVLKVDFESRDRQQVAAYTQLIKK